MSTAGPAHRVQSAVVEYGYPQGHMGHLTNDEEAAFINFKVICQEKGIYSPATADHPPSHDDATLLRFLRARRFVATDALTQFADTEEWRKANQIDQLYETIDLEQYEETRMLYPQWTGRRDRRGIPVYVYEVKHLNAKTMASYEKSAKETSSKAKTDGTIPAKMLRLFALYENLVRFTMPLCSALTDRDHPHTPITQSNNIVDISGVGLKQFWNLRGHMQDASTLATAHYPETLDRIFIIGAPSFFPTVWGWIKKWFDPITTSKIFILSQSDLKQTLESFIDPKNIPKKYGGELKFEFGDQPQLDPHLASVAKWEGDNKDFPHGPMYWINKSKDGKQIEAMAVGTKDGKQRKEAVCTVTTNYDEEKVAQAANSNLTALRAEKPDFSRVPTAAPSVAETTTDLQRSEPSEANEQSVPKVVQNGEVVPATRPEPVSFVTAAQGIETLSLNEKRSDLSERGTNGQHVTAVANLLDPSLKLDGAADSLPLENAHQHHEASDKSDPTVGGGVEEADKAHVAPTNGHSTTTNGHGHGKHVKETSRASGEGKRHSGVFGKVKAKVGL